MDRGDDGQHGQRRENGLPPEIRGDRSVHAFDEGQFEFVRNKIKVSRGEEENVQNTKNMIGVCASLCEGAGVESPSESFLTNDNEHDILKHRDDEEKKAEVNEAKQDDQVLGIELSACENGGAAFSRRKKRNIFNDIMSPGMDIAEIPGKGGAIAWRDARREKTAEERKNEFDEAIKKEKEIMKKHLMKKNESTYDAQDHKADGIAEYKMSDDWPEINELYKTCMDGGKIIRARQCGAVMSNMPSWASICSEESEISFDGEEFQRKVEVMMENAKMKIKIKRMKKKIAKVKMKKKKRKKKEYIQRDELVSYPVQ